MNHAVDNRAILVMSRVPIPGKTKTRLLDVLSEDESAGLHKAFLLDMLDMLEKVVKTKVYIAFTPENEEKNLASMIDSPVDLIPQAGSDLGERMLNGIRRLKNLGHTPICVIGSDSPTLQPRHLEDAFKSLDQSDICVGPSEDGGYYLIGMKKSHPEVFCNIDWGTDRVFAQTINIGEKKDIKIKTLDKWYDVDTSKSLHRLRKRIVELADDPGIIIPARTERLLRTMS